MPPEKLLILVRHAKSSWKDATLRDRDRPLNKRGQRDAPEMGRRLRVRGFVPDVILSSPAVRALATARAIAQQLQIQEDAIVVDERLYHPEPDDIFEVVSELPDSVSSALVVSHNPALTELASACFDPSIENVPTAGTLMISADRWDAVRHGRLILFDYPKAPPPEAGSQQ